jgi:hypothetical protein
MSMSRSGITSLVLIAATVAAMLVWKTERDAASRAESSLARVRVLLRQVDQLTRLGSDTPPWAARQRPAPGVAGRLSAALTTSGIPSAVLADVSPQADAPFHDGPGRTGSAGLRRQRTSLTLTSVTLSQLGAFLGVWRQQEPCWIVTSIDLSPERTGKETAADAGGQLPLHAVLIMDAVYLDSAGDRP